MVEGESIVFIVPEGAENERADKVLASHFTDFSRTQIQKSFDTDRVKLNGEVISRKVRVSSGDKLEITFLHPKETPLHPVDISLDVLYEDEDIIAVNKIPGMVVHPGKGTGEDTMVHALLHHTKGNLAQIAGTNRPGIVHRLDKETSGAILFAKSDKAYLHLINAFSNRTVKKEYLAIVSGIPHLESGSIKEPIKRHPVNPTKMVVSSKGRDAHTDWVLEKELRSCALLRCYLHTGRTHQIRVHLSHIKHPILGDSTYGYRFRKEHIQKPERILLHAEIISFTHPTSGELITLKAPIPEDFKIQIGILG